MKKIVSFLLFAAAFLLTGCQATDVKEADLLGAWQLMVATEDGVREDISSDNVIYEFAADHKFYVTNTPRGYWQLTGNKLYISYDDIDWTVSKLTTTSLVLRYEEYDEGEYSWLLYEFRRVQ